MFAQSIHRIIPSNKPWLIVKIAAGIAAVVLLTLLLSGAVVTLGKNIPQTNVLSDYLIGLFFAIILGLSILVWRVPARDKPHLLTIWIVKCIVVLGFMLFYEAYYSVLDAYSYFNLPRQPSFEPTGFSIGKGTENIYQLVWLWYRVLPESYHALKISCAMLGLVGVYLFYQAAVIFLEKEDIRLLYILAFFPSVLFWSSILGKDPISLSGIALYTYGIVGWYQRRQFRYLWLSALGVMIAMYIRIWLGVILLAPTLVLVLLVLRTVRGNLPKILITIVVVSTLIVAANQIQNYFGIESFDRLARAVNEWSSQWDEEWGFPVKITTNISELKRAIALMPLGMVITLFDPFPKSVSNPFSLFACLENWLLLVMLWKAITRSRWQDLKEPVILWGMLLVMTWVPFYAFISTSRYRMQIFPILLGVLLYLGRRRTVVPNQLCLDGSSQEPNT